MCRSQWACVKSKWGSAGFLLSASHIRSGVHLEHFIFVEFQLALLCFFGLQVDVYLAFWSAGFYLHKTLDYFWWYGNVFVCLFHFHENFHSFCVSDRFSQSILYVLGCGLSQFGDPGFLSCSGRFQKICVSDHFFLFWHFIVIWFAVIQANFELRSLISFIGLYIPFP